MIQIIINKDGKTSEVIKVDSSKFKNLDDLRFDENKGSKSSEFDIKSFMQMKLDAVDCYDVAKASKEFKESVKRENMVTRTIKAHGGEITFCIIYKLSYASKTHVVSCNRFLAMCSGVVAINEIGEFYSETLKDYKKTDSVVKLDSGINRLAEKIGIKKDSRLYWLYCVGVENLYPVFPFEVLAIVSWKILNTERSGLKGTNYELTKSITNQFVKMPVKLDDNKIKMYYNELDQCVHTSASVERAEKMYNQLRSIFKGVKTSAASTSDYASFLNKN